jgi:16S rRNA (guanine527-N7)-methyltransferase
LPGLPLAVVWPNTHWILLDAGANRTAFLRRAVGRLELSDRVEVVHQRAEEAGRGNLRGSAESVLARSFGAPGVTAECAAPLLRVGGTLVVAEPPGGDIARWNVAGLALLGMKLGHAITAPTACQIVLQEAPCPSRFPRRTGVPAKRPLF